jgi:L-ribulose-5-phosphate 3-epimerase
VTALGMMEGRLLPPEADRIQAFPRDRWADEFDLAKQVPLSYIEWIYDGYGADVNPLMHDVSSLQSLIAGSRVAVRSICADYFMEFPFVRCTGVQRAQRRGRLIQLLEKAQAIGAGRVVIPFVDNAQIVTASELDTVVSVLEQTVPAARSLGVELHLETALDPSAVATLLKRLDDPLIKVNYDTGNSSALGYRPKDELDAYGARIGSVHIKDRMLGAGTVPLGTGDTDFAAFFASLRRLRYAGDFTLQAARAQTGDEVAWARQSRAFVARHWPLE